MQSEISITSGSGGSAWSGYGIGGRGGDVHLHHDSESTDTLLMSLPRALYAGHDSGRADIPSCLEGTRTAILEEIMSWSESANGERSPVYWLSGLAGLGKSSIAKTVAILAEERGILVASFFFARSDAPLRDPHLVFPTLAFQLAQSDYAFKDVIVETLRYNPIAGHRELLSQLSDLILAPLLESNPVRRPVLIILDALDECEEMGAEQILQLVYSHAIRIPSLRTLITSRPHPRLSFVFNQVPNLAKTILHDVEASVIQQDIRFYISTELAKIPQKLGIHMPTNWATETQKNLLVEKSGRLFVYAASAIRFIGDPRIRHPRRHLRLILDAQSARQAGVTPYSLLDDLYMGVLRNSLSPYNRRGIFERFQIVVGSLVLLRTPLPLHSLARFVQYESDVVDTTLRTLHSVIVSPSNIHDAPSIYHPSFLEFITDASRCSMAEFVIVPSQQELRHALRCFELMAIHLRQDVAGISDPSPLNREGDGFERKVRKALPPEVQYACRYWVSHLSHVGFGEKMMMEALEAFSMRSILWWFEAMSLIGSLSTAVDSIQDAHRWAASSKSKSIVVKILDDAYRFILTHGERIRGSALYVYEAFISSDTVLSKAYRERGWPSNLDTLHALSPDELHLASGTTDHWHTQGLWDPMSAKPIAKLEGGQASVPNQTGPSSNVQPSPTDPPDLTEHIVRSGLAPMATGSYSSVWRGSLPFPPDNPDRSLQVAIKVLRYPHPNEHIAKRKLYKHLHAEMRIWAQVHHENVVTLLGHTREPEGPGLVSMAYLHGNVLDFLANNSNVNREVLCADVALELQYLHEHRPPIIHGDLKGPNVLINSEGKASICDFGLSLILDGGPTGFTSSNFAGTLRFLAPELLDESTKSVHTDIYAYACTCIQILFDQEPYHQIPKDGPLVRAILEHRPPYNPSNEEVTFPGLFEILKDCWDHNQSSRPSLNLIIDTIQQCLYHTYQANAFVHRGIGHRLRFISVPGVEQAKLLSVADDGLSIIVDCSTSFCQIPIYQRYRWEWLDAQNLEPESQDLLLATSSSLLGTDPSPSENHPYISEWGDYSMKFRLVYASRVSYKMYDETTLESV